MAQSLGPWIASRAARTPETVALVDAATGERSTYAEVEQRVAAIAADLQGQGVRRGDRVALLSPNSTTLLETLFAVTRLGAVTVPVDVRLSAAEIGFIVDDARPVVLVHDGTLATLAKASIEAAEHGTPRLIEDTMLGNGEDRASLETVGPDEVAMIMYTSGTTGRPKGAMFTHGDLEWSAVDMPTAGEGLLPTGVTLAVALPRAS